MYASALGAPGASRRFRLLGALLMCFRSVLLVLVGRLSVLECACWDFSLSFVLLHQFPS